MVNLNAPEPPEMTEIDGQLYRPEHVEDAKMRAETRNKMVVAVGVQDPVPIGVAEPTDRRRRTEREYFLAENDPTPDPASTALTRVAVEDVGPVTADPLAQVDTSAAPDPAAAVAEPVPGQSTSTRRRTSTKSDSDAEGGE